jgi:hypothetical protein
VERVAKGDWQTGRTVKGDCQMGRTVREDWQMMDSYGRLADGEDYQRRLADRRRIRGGWQMGRTLSVETDRWD